MVVSFLMFSSIRLASRIASKSFVSGSLYFLPLTPLFTEATAIKRSFGLFLLACASTLGRGVVYPHSGHVTEDLFEVPFPT